MTVFSFLLFLSSCDNQSQKTNITNKKPGVDNLTKAEAHSYLEALAMELAFKDPATGALSKSTESHGLLKQNNLAKLLKDEKVNISDVITGVAGNISVDGVPYDVNVEIFNVNALVKLSKSLKSYGEQFGIYVDPANYYDGKSNHVDFPVQVVTLENGIYKSHEELLTAPYAADIDEIDDEFNQFIDQLKQNTQYPLFAITLEYAGEDPEDIKQGLSKPSQPALILVWKACT